MRSYSHKFSQGGNSTLPCSYVHADQLTFLLWEFTLWVAKVLIWGQLRETSSRLLIRKWYDIVCDLF